MEITWIGVAALVAGPLALALVAIARAGGAGEIAGGAAPAAAPASGAAAPVAAEAPPPAAAAAPLASALPGAPARLEERIALVWFTRVGALAVFVGAVYFLKYAMDNDWLGPWGRVAGAFLAGATAVIAGDVLRPRARAVWILALQGAGVALLFFAAIASHALYELVPVAAALAAAAAVALLGGALALRHRSEALLVIALVGGLLAPALVAADRDWPLAIAAYLLVLGGLALLVSIRLGFRIAPWFVLAGTVAVGAGWWERFFEVGLPPGPDPSATPLEQAARYHALLPRAVPIAAVLAFAASWLAAWERSRAAPARAGSEAWLGSALLFTTAAPFLLVYDRPLPAAVALAGASAVVAAFLRRAGRLPYLLAAEVGSLVLLCGAIVQRPAGEGGAWIAAAAVVATAYLAVAAHAWLVRRDAPDGAVAATAAVAALAFAAFAIVLAGEGALRAALVAAAGAAALALGVAVLRRAHAYGSALLGTGVALLAVAAAFLLSGAAVTVVWAAMACAVAALGARARDARWLAAAGALLAAALSRAVTFDLEAVGDASSRFLETAGAEGRLAAAFLLNARAAALAAVAVALLFSADRVRRLADARWRLPARIAAGVAWALVVALAVTEARDLALSLPDPPAAGGAAAFEGFRAQVADAVRAQGGSLSAVASLVMAACAALLVAGGLVFRDAFHRWLGIGLFGIVVGKLLVADVWWLSRLQQVAVFTGVGVLLLAAAFLYGRYGRRAPALL